MLTVEEVHFLRKQGLSKQDVFDAREIPLKEAKPQAKLEGKSVLLGSKCQKAGHRLRTRSGHCIQCDTSKIAFAGRNSTPADFYLAFTPRGNLVKFGISSDAHQREESLRTSKYGGFDDWQIIVARRVKAAEQLESHVKSVAAESSASLVYEKDGRDQEARECFRLAKAEAIRIYEAAVANHGMSVDSNYYRSRHYQTFMNG